MTSRFVSGTHPSPTSHHRQTGINAEALLPLGRLEANAERAPAWFACVTPFQASLGQRPSASCRQDLLGLSSCLFKGVQHDLRLFRTTHIAGQYEV